MKMLARAHPDDIEIFMLGLFTCKNRGMIYTQLATSDGPKGNVMTQNGKNKRLREQWCSSRNK